MKNNINNEEIGSFLFGPGLHKEKLDISFYALKEAEGWYNIARDIICQDPVSQQAYVMLLYTIELLLKALLSNEGKNIICRNYQIHNIKELYARLSNPLKDYITNNIKIVKDELPDDVNYRIKSLTTFEDYIGEISNDFVDLRYLYENFNKDFIVYIPSKFILDLADTLLKLVEREFNNIYVTRTKIN